jgi:hypothetical protein
MFNYGYSAEAHVYSLRSYFQQLYVVGLSRINATMAQQGELQWSACACARMYGLDFRV